jgi:hypothetical protein
MTKQAHSSLWPLVLVLEHHHILQALKRMGLLVSMKNMSLLNINILMMPQRIPFRF